MTGEDFFTGLPKRSYEDSLQEQFDKPIRIEYCEQPEDLYKLMEKTYIVIDQLLKGKTEECEKDILNKDRFDC